MDLHSVNHSSVVIDFPSVFIDVALVIGGAEEPRSTACGVTPVESVIISVSREGIVAPAPCVSVLRVVVRMRGINAEEVADTITNGSRTLVSWVVARPIRVRVL